MGSPLHGSGNHIISRLKNINKVRDYSQKQEGCVSFTGGRTQSCHTKPVIGTPSENLLKPHQNYK